VCELAVEIVAVVAMIIVLLPLQPPLLLLLLLLLHTHTLTSYLAEFGEGFMGAKQSQKQKHLNPQMKHY
jgi:hypothetical protein